MQQVEPAVALDVEHEIELARLLVAEEPADVDAGRVHEHVDAAVPLPDLIDDRGHRVGVGQVDAVVVRLAARAAHRIDRLLRGVQPFDARRAPSRP